MISDREYVQSALDGRDKPIMDLTNRMLGSSPFGDFKKLYNENKGKRDEEILALINGYDEKRQYSKILPLQYILGERGSSHPLYKRISNTEVKNIISESNSLSKDYMDQSIATAGLFTGVAGVDSLRDSLAQHSVIPGNIPSTANINMTNYAPWRPFKDMGDPYTLSKRSIEESLLNRARYRIDLAGKSIHGNAYDSFVTHFGSDVGESLSSGMSNRGRVFNRLMGYASSVPRAALYVSPLLVNSITSRLKGTDENSARHKAITWAENNPVSIVGAAVAPGFVANTLKETAILRDMLRSGVKGSSLAQPFLALGRNAMAVSVPLGFAALKKKYDQKKSFSEDIAIEKRKEV